MIRLSMITIVLILAATPGARAQADGSGRLGSGVASRLADVLGEEKVTGAKETTLDDLADAVTLSLDSVDRSRVADVNDELSRLRDEESELRSMLDELRHGIPIDIDSVSSPSSVDDVDASTLELESQVLASMMVKVEQLEERDRQRQAYERRRRQAMQLTRKSEVLLASLDVLPDADPETDGVMTVSKTAFPGRLAHALYLARDFTGALRHYRTLEEKDMTAEQRFETSRCLEETGLIDEAVAMLGRLAADGSVEVFWKNRAAGLSEFLTKSRSIRNVLQPAENP